VHCDQQDFVVTATPAPETFGAKQHNPVISVDKHLEIRE
jgi:hypothetical protein